MKNTLPRKRKKALIKKEGSLSYISAQVANEWIFKRDGHCDYRFPKLGKAVRGKFQILGYW